MNKLFENLCSEVQGCLMCSRMEGSQRVLNRACGNVDAKVMFIGEAPGRLGADGSGIPFHGDKSGHNFEELLTFSRLSRHDIFVSNAVLCNPKDEKGNNSTPNLNEMQNCMPYLRRQIELINPALIVTLGGTALNSLSLIERHEYELKKHVRQKLSWFGRILIPLYHPGARAMIHRSMANQRSDYQFVGECFRRLGEPSTRVYGKTSTAVAEFVKRIIIKSPGITYFQLHKIMYLCELDYWRTNAEVLTGAYFVRQKDGPYCTELHLAKLKKALPDLKDKWENGKIHLFIADQPGLFDEMIWHDTATPFDGLIDRVCNKYLAISESELKTRVYLTEPMKEILKLEKDSLLNYYNSPIRMYR